MGRVRAFTDKGTKERDVLNANSRNDDGPYEQNMKGKVQTVDGSKARSKE